MEWSNDEINRIVIDFCNDFDKTAILSNNKDKVIIRYPLDSSKNIIIKLWSRQHFGGTLRKFLNRSLAEKEWYALNYVSSLKVNVPKVLGWSSLPTKPRGFTEALIMEDLGSCRSSLDYIKQCIAASEEQKLQVFEAKIVKMTAVLVKGKLLDIDHTLVNIVVNDDDEPYRLDFELAEHISSFSFRFLDYGKMIGKLLTTYTFAVQPETERVHNFYNNLCHNIAIPKISLWVAKRVLKKRLDNQNEKFGIKSQLELK